MTKQLSVCFGNRDSPLTLLTGIAVTCTHEIIDFGSDSVLRLAAHGFQFHFYNFVLVMAIRDLGFCFGLVFWCLLVLMLPSFQEQVFFPPSISVVIVN